MNPSNGAESDIEHDSGYVEALEDAIAMLKEGRA